MQQILLNETFAIVHFRNFIIISLKNQYNFHLISSGFTCMVIKYLIIVDCIIISLPDVLRMCCFLLFQKFHGHLYDTDYRGGVAPRGIKGCSLSV